MLDALTAWEGQLLLFIQERLRGGVGDALTVLWTTLGDEGLIWIAAGVVMLFFRRTRRAGALALAGMLLNLIVVNCTLKPLVARPRPWQVFPGLEPLVESAAFRSFPSGHTSSSFAFALGLWGGLDVRWARTLALTAAALMGLSRLYVGVHYPSDVLAGAVIGSLCGLAAAFLYRRFFMKRFPLQWSC